MPLTATGLIVNVSSGDGGCAAKSMPDRQPGKQNECFGFKQQLFFYDPTNGAM
jgi:hypothetical protein